MGYNKKRSGKIHKTAGIDSVWKSMAGFEVFSTHFPAFDTRIVGYILGKLCPSAIANIEVRSKLIDRLLASEVQNGLVQVLELGAGYSTRALRFSPNISFYELDLPKVCNRKKKILGELKRSLTHLQIGSIELGKESISSRLEKMGFDASRKTFVILESVSMYLNPNKMHTILSEVAEFMRGTGSVLVTDFINRKKESQPKDTREKSFGWILERFINYPAINFGITDPEQGIEFLSKIGYTNIEQYDFVNEVIKNKELNMGPRLHDSDSILFSANIE